MEQDQIRSEGGGVAMMDPALPTKWKSQSEGRTMVDVGEQSSVYFR